MYSDNVSQSIYLQKLAVLPFLNDYRNQLLIDVTCYIQSLIFMMLGHMGETHTDGIPCIS